MSELENTPEKNLKINRSDWEIVKFGDVAIQQKETVDRKNTDLTYYVKGEHMRTEDIHLREWGDLKDEYLGPAFTRYFEEGDILYGSRRTYLKKIAVAHFNGITSNTTLVIKPNTELIDSRLLPYLMLSDGFTDHSIMNSKGSVNPYVNWKDLANYEFLLPPKAQQAQLAELLWAMDEVNEREKWLLKKAIGLKQSTVRNKCIINQGRHYKLKDLISGLEAGVSVNSEEGELKDNDFGILKTSSVSEGFFNPSEVKKVKANEIDRLKTPVVGDSIIISRMNTVDLVGANAYVDKSYDNVFLPDRLWQTQEIRKDANVKFLWFILSSPFYRSKISELCSGTSNSMKNISKKAILDLDIIIPTRESQDEIVAEIDLIINVIEDIGLKIQNFKSLQKSLINQIF